MMLHASRQDQVRNGGLHAGTRADSCKQKCIDASKVNAHENGDNGDNSDNNDTGQLTVVPTAYFPLERTARLGQGAGGKSRARGS